MELNCNLTAGYLIKQGRPSLTRDNSKRQKTIKVWKGLWENGFLITCEFMSLRVCSKCLASHDIKCTKCTGFSLGKQCWSTLKDTYEFSKSALPFEKIIKATFPLLRRKCPNLKSFQEQNKHAIRKKIMANLKRIAFWYKTYWYFNDWKAIWEHS